MVGTCVNNGKTILAGVVKGGKKFEEFDRESVLLLENWSPSDESRQQPFRYFVLLQTRMTHRR